MKKILIISNFLLLSCLIGFVSFNYYEREQEKAQAKVFFTHVAKAIETVNSFKFHNPENSDLDRKIDEIEYIIIEDDRSYPERTTEILNVMNSLSNYTK